LKSFFSPAELAYSQGKTALLAAFLNIYKAMGGGWVNKTDELTQAQSAPGP
jgi:outer membrane protein, multidrug efflux system